MFKAGSQGWLHISKGTLKYAELMLKTISARVKPEFLVSSNTHLLHPVSPSRRLAVHPGGARLRLRPGEPTPESQRQRRGNPKVHAGLGRARVRQEGRQERHAAQPGGQGRETGQVLRSGAVLRGEDPLPAEGG